MKVHMRTLGILKWSSRKRNAIRRLLRHSPDLQGFSKDTVSCLSKSKPALFGEETTLAYIAALA